MAQKLKLTNRLATGLLRLARKDVQQICRDLNRPHGDSGRERLSKNIHEARRRIKRLRALLRLTRDHLDGNFRRRQNSAWRDIAHALSPLRDTEIQLETLQKLREHCPKEITNDVFSRAAESLSQKNEHHPHTAAGPGHALQKKLRATLAGIEHLPLHDLKGKHLRSGLKRAWQEYRKGYKLARKSATDDDLHDWRKKAKDLAHQMDATEAEIFQRKNKLITQLLKLGKILGEDHDLVVLETRIRQLAPDTTEKLQKPIKKRRAKLQKAAFKLGRQL